MKLLVCGGRTFDDREWAFQVLDEFHAKHPVELLMHGGANGADALAHQWARERGILRKRFSAEWTVHSHAAGPQRNTRMIDEEPDFVIAFPGGTGTADLVAKARYAGIPIREVKKVQLKILQGGTVTKSTAIEPVSRKIQRPPPPGRMTTADAKKLGALCDLCPLSKRTVAPSIVPCTAVKDPKFIFIGEGPGRMEENYGKPFIGPTGAFVNALMREAKIDRAQGHITNSAMCRGETDKEKIRASECCAPRLLRELEGLPQDIPILVAGKPAMKSILGIAKIFYARGFYWKAPALDPKVVGAAQRKALKMKDNAQVLEFVRRAQTLEGRSKLAGRVVLPTLHPAFVFRADSWKPAIQADFRRFGRVIRGELTEENLADNKPYIVLKTPWKIEKYLRSMGPTVAVDIETDGTDPMRAPILCVGISDGVKTLVVGPWDAKQHALAVSLGLRGKTQVFHNGVNFDIIALRRDGVEILDECVRDTLIAHHVIGSHFPQRLDHCVSMYLDSSPWKIKAGRKGAEEKGLLPVAMAPRERHKYNAADAVLTAQLWEAMQDDLKPFWPLFLSDMQLALEATMQLIMTGIGIDVPLREELRHRMKKRQDALKGIMRKLVGDPAFNPSKDVDIRKHLFGTFGAPIISRTPTGLASTASTTLEVYKGNGTRAGTFCAYVLEWRSVRKSRTTYIDTPDLAPQIVPSLGIFCPRVRVNWKVYATPTGRWGSRLQSVVRPAFVTRCRACGHWAVTTQVCDRCRNAQAERKGEERRKVVESRIRELYIPRPGCEFVYFDLSQAEAHVAAFISQDPEFMATCLGGDVHTGNACAIFPEYAEAIRKDTKGVGKPFRDIAKNFMFGIIYGAAADTIHKFLLGKGFKTKLREVEHLLKLLHRKYKVYFRYAENNVAICRRLGWLESPIAHRRRFFGFKPKPEEVFNFPEQAGVADIMNERLLEILPQLPTQTLFVGQWHDACIFESPTDGRSDQTLKLVKKTFKRPVVIPKGLICSSEVSYHQPIDAKKAMRWSEL